MWLLGKHQHQMVEHGPQNEPVSLAVFEDLFRQLLVERHYALKQLTKTIAVSLQDLRRECQLDELHQWLLLQLRLLLLDKAPALLDNFLELLKDVNLYLVVCLLILQLILEYWDIDEFEYSEDGVAECVSGL